MNILLYGYDLYDGSFENAMYFLNKRYDVRITDLRKEEELGESIQILKAKGAQIIAGAHRVEDFEWADAVLKIQAISPDNPFLAYSHNVISDYTYLFDNENVAKVKLICITGTSGKTITSSAVCHALNAMGKKARVCGNTGNSPLTELERWENADIPEYLVCEMSSLQIRDIYLNSNGYIPAVELLTVSSNTINQKLEMFESRTRFILCSGKNRQALRNKLKANILQISTIESFVNSISETIPKNLFTAFAVLKRLGFRTAQINSALKSFKGIPHRKEIVSSENGILVINDSSSTTPEATAITLDTLKDNPVHLICGGSGKDMNVDSLSEHLEHVSSTALLDGSFTRNALIPALEKKGIAYSGPYKDMKEAVDSILHTIEQDKKILQVILLSPGAQAFEYFRNEADRGDCFKSCFQTITQ